MKKRVLALTLLVLFVLCGVLASCGGGEAHVHTYKDTWTKDASGHWYDPTCECTDAPRTVLAHADNNNDGACDVCTYTEHTHTYSENYTADCTNHWNAADCGHTVAGANVEAHIDETGDGVCDVCKYVIEDLHNHYYSTEWTADGEYHWHAALCEHNVEVSDKEAHNINDAGYCTVCDKQINEIDKTDFLAVLKAAIANNYKVVTGNVELEQIVYDGSESKNTLTLLDKAYDGVYFVLGNGQSYYFLKNYDDQGKLIGGEQQWFEDLGNDNIFGVKMDVNAYTLDSVMGDPAKLSGYTYQPGSILAAGYDDTNTLAQTIYNFYDLMTKGVNVSDVSMGIDDNGRYSFSFTYFTVNEQTSGGVVFNTELALYETDISFTINDDFIIDVADIQVKVYNYYDEGKAENDLAYDKETNTITKTEYANPSYYIYNVYQTSGERTFTTPYPRASLIPQGFDFFYVTDSDFPSAAEWVIYEEILVEDRLVLAAGTYASFHLGNPYPATTSFNFIEDSDFTYTFVNKNPDSIGRAWYMDPGSVDLEILNGYMPMANCLKLKLRDPGTYTVTIGFGKLVKTFELVIEGEPIPEIVATENSISVLVVDLNTYSNDAQSYTLTAQKEGNYTFTVPAGLGVLVDGEEYPRVDLYEDEGGTFTIGLNAGESVKLYFAANDSSKRVIDLSFEEADIPDPLPPEGDDVVDAPALKEGSNTVSFTANEIAADSATRILEITTAGAYKFPSSNLFISSIVDADGNAISKDSSQIYNLVPGTYTVTFGMFKMLSVKADTNYTITAQNTTPPTVEPEVPPTEEPDEPELEGSGTSADPYIITAGDYVAPFKGGSDLVYYSFTATESGFVTLKSTFDGTPWLILGAESNEGYLTTLTAFVPAGGTIIMQVGDWDEQSIDVPFTVSFEAKASDDFSALVGTWYGASEGWTTVNYTLVINADGTGSISYDMGYGATTYNVEYVFVEGQKVTIGYKTSYSSAAIECTYDGTTFACTKGVMQDDFVFTTEQPSGGDDETGIFAGDEIFEGTNIVTITADDKAAGSITLTIVATKTTNYYFRSGSFMITKVTGPDGDIQKVEYKYALVEGNEYTLTISMMFISNPGDYDIIVETPDYVEPVDYTADVIGGYENVNGYNVLVYENFGIANAGDYIAEIYDDNYTVDLYFTVVAEPNGDGSYTLNLTYFSHADYEVGAENVDAILAETFIVTPGAGEEGGDEVQTGLAGLINTYVDEALNGLNVGFFTENGVYYLNVYGGGSDLYYICDATENADGSVTLVLTFDADNESYLEEQTDAYELDGVTVVAAVVDNSWTFAVEGEEPSVPQGPSGTFADPFELLEENTCNFPGGYSYIFYKYTAETAGMLTITVTSDNYEWAYGFGEYAMNFVTGSTETIELSANQTVYIGMSTANPYGAGTIDFTATFAEGEAEEPVVEPDGSEENPFALVMGDNELLYQGFAYAWALYKFEAPEAGTLVITMTSTNFDLGYGSNPMRISGSQSSPLSINLEAGQTIWIGITTASGSQSSTPITFTASFGNGEGDDVVEETKEAELVLGNNSVNSENINFVYNATADIEIQLAVGTASGDTVNVKYAVNNGTAIAIANGSTVKVKLTNGDKLTVYAETKDGFLTITASEVVKEVEGPTLSGTGTQRDPYIIDTLPLELNFSGKFDKYYKFTATEDGVLKITYTDGTYVSDLPSYEKDSENKIYTVSVKAGDSFVMNLWTSRTSGEFKYTIEMIASVVTPDPEEPGEGGGEATGSEEVYIGSGNGRGMKVIINKAADTLVIIRAVSGSLTNFEGGTTYNLVYSEILGNAVDGVYPGFIPNTSIMNLKFDENGAVSEFAWNGTTFKDFVLQNAGDNNGGSNSGDIETGEDEI